MRVFRVLIALLVGIVLIGGPTSDSAPVLAQDGQCSLIDNHQVAAPNDGQGGRYYGFLPGGATVSYSFTFEGSEAGCGFSAVLEADTPVEVFSDGSPNTGISGSFVIPEDGTYTLDGGCGGADAGLVHAVAEYDCQLAEVLCEILGSATGTALATGFETTIEQGAYVSVLVERQSDNCHVEFGIHGPGGFGPDPEQSCIGGGGGDGSASTSILIPETGLYGFGIGPTDETSECQEGLVTITAYVGCPFGIGVGVPNRGLVKITADQPQTAHYAAGGGVIEVGGAALVLPADADGNGFDTYTVTGQTEVDGQTWLSIFLGGRQWGWVPLSGVVVLEGSF